jgi:hypothetical protein
MSSDSRKKLTAKRQNTNEFKQTFPQLANTKDDKLVALSPEMLQRVLTEVKKTNQNLFEEDPMKLDLDQLVKLATTVKKRGLDGELKVPLLLSSDDESKVSARTKQGYTKKSKAAGAPRRPQNHSESASSAESSDADDEEGDEEDEEEAPVIEPEPERYMAAIVLVNGQGNFEKTNKITDTLLGRVYSLESLDPERLKEGTSYLREVVFDAIPLDTNKDSFKRKTGFDYPGDGKIDMTFEDDLQIKLGAGATGTLTHIDDLSEDDRTDPKRCSEVWQIAKGSFKSKNLTKPLQSHAAINVPLG